MSPKNESQNSPQQMLRAKNFEQVRKDAEARGHKFEPPKIGKVSGRIVTQCYECGAYLYALESGATGGAATVIECGGGAPTPYGRILAAQAAAAEAQQQPVPLYNRSHSFNPPNKQEPCEFCGNGATLVGGGCKQCNPYRRIERTGRSRNNRSYSAKPPKQVKSGGQVFDYTKEQKGTYEAPCGEKCSTRHIYMESDWTGETAFPATITRYMCQDRCIVRTDPPKE